MEGCSERNRKEEIIKNEKSEAELAEEKAADLAREAYAKKYPGPGSSLS